MTRSAMRSTADDDEDGDEGDVDIGMANFFFFKKN